MGGFLDITLSILRTLALTLTMIGAGAANADITLFEGQDLHGRVFIANRALPSFARTGFGNNVMSVVVRGRPWQVCQELNFSGQCVVLKPGHYPSPSAMGLDNKPLSARPAARSKHLSQG